MSRSAPADAARASAGVNRSGMTATPNKLAGSCRCGIRLESGHGLWIADLRHLRCALCHQQDLDLARAGAVRRAEVTQIPFAERPKVRLFFNVQRKRAVARALDISETLFKTFRVSCEAAGLDWQDGGFVGRVELIPEAIKLLERDGLTVEVSDNLADALLERAQQIRSAVAAASVRATSADGRGRRLKDYQLVGVEFIASRTALILGDDMGLGKAQPVETPVLTPLGWRKIGDILVGDEVIGSNGRPVKVTGVFPQGRREVFKVAFSDGASTECCDEHLWSVNTPLRRSRGRPPRVSALSAIRESLRDGSGNRMHFIPLVDAVQFASRRVDLHPYLMGALIGDGGFTGHSVIFSKPDEQLGVRLCELLPRGAFIKRIDECDWRITGNGSTHLNANPVKAALRRYGLDGLESHERFVPEDYLLTDPAARLELLRGLMDTDGTIDENGHHAEFNSTSRRLAENLIFIVRSLGGTTKLKSRKPKFAYKGEVKVGRTDWRVTVCMPGDMNPFWLERKASRWYPRQKYQPARAFDSVSSVGAKKCVCISVDAPDHLYVTQDLVLTHNTAQILRAAPPRPRLLIIAPKIMRGSVVDGKPMGGWSDEIALWRPDVEKVTIIDEETDFRWPEENEAVLINYERLPPAPDEYAEKRAKAIRLIAKAKKNGEPAPVLPEIERRSTAPEPPEGVDLVADEAHRLCDPKSLQTRRTKHLVHLVLANGGRARGVTATPLKNDEPELWTILDVFTIAQQAFGSFENYARMHNYRMESLPNGKAKWVWGAPTPEVAERLARVLLRRRKRDVLTELPPITIRRVVVDIDDAAVTKACDKAMSDIEKAGLNFAQALELVNETKKSKLDITVISKALSALAKVKAPYAIELAKERERTGTPSVFFSAHVALVEQLGRRKGWGTLLGGDKSTINLEGEPRRTGESEVVAAFQTSLIENLACTIQKAGVGINLTRASDAVLAGQLWSPVLNDQAIARLDRLGQLNPMTILVIVANHPLDIHMTEVLERKIALFAGSVDAAAVAVEDLGKRRDVAVDLIEAAGRRVSRGRMQA